MGNVTLFHIVGGGIAAVIIGFVWYYPFVFGGLRMRAPGVSQMASETSARRFWGIVLDFLMGTLVAYVMSYFGVAWGVYDWLGALQLGFWSWAGFVLPIVASTYAHDHRALRIFFIDVLYWLVTFMAIALVLIA